MQVVLNEDVKKLGYRGEVVNVKRGFYRNYLFPQGLADVASASRLKVNDSRKEKMVMKKEQVLENTKETLAKLKGLKVTIKAKVTDKGHLYGSISEDDVLKALKDEAKLSLDKSFIKMGEHFKDLGEYEVVVDLGEGASEKISVVIEALEEKK